MNKFHVDVKFSCSYEFILNNFVIITLLTEINLLLSYIVLSTHYDYIF